MKTIAVVVPVFYLKDDRLLNFLFNIKHLNTISDRCEVIVSEQIHPDSVIVDFLKIYPNITHLRFELGDVFNKSTLINRAFESSSADYLWVVDADYYTNYEHIIDSVDDFTEFTCPHSEVILLNKTETDKLIESDYVQITRSSYESSSANGKYSFIVSSNEFKTAGMMNENFEGWGFQDLDFVENRMTTQDVSNLNILGFHLNHPPASRECANDNKLLYMGIYSHQQSDNPQPTISQMIPITQDAPPITSNLNNPDSQNTTTPFHHIHITFYNDSDFATQPSTELIHIPRTTSVKRHLTGALKASSYVTSFVFYYIKYIIDNYDSLVGTLMFSTDFFKNNPRIYNSKIRGELIKSSKCPPPDFVNFKWMGPTKKMQMKKTPGVAGEYEKFNRIYSSDLTKKPNLIYSRVGAFLVSSGAVKSRPIGFYEDIYNNLEVWGAPESQYMLMTLKNIFS